MADAMTARILFIEDSGEEAFLAQYHLTRAGIRSEGRLVRDQLSQQRVLSSWAPDLIVADFTLSQFDGWTAYVTSGIFAPDVPFIFRSRNITKKRAQRARERGVLACVHKEDIERFNSLVNAALTRSTPALRR
jgi:DNA-binding NtrC family response regulator